MPTTEELILKVLTDTRDIKAKFKGITKSVDDVGKKTKAVTAASKGTLASLKLAWIAVGAAVLKAVQFIKGTLDAFGKQEEAQITLAAAMKTAGTFTEEAFQHNLDYAASLQKITTEGDETILAVQKLLTNYGAQGKELDLLTEATLDFAAATGMQLEAAAALVGKTIGSTTNALTRYGITVDGGVNSTERMQSAVEGIAKLFGGAAQAKAQTFTGRMQQLSNVFGDVKEVIGGFVATTLDPFVTGLIILFTNETKVEKITKDLTAAYGDYQKAVIDLKVNIDNLTESEREVLETRIKLSKLVFERKLIELQSEFNRVRKEGFGIFKSEIDAHKNIISDLEKEVELEEKILQKLVDQDAAQFRIDVVLARIHAATIQLEAENTKLNKIYDSEEIAIKEIAQAYIDTNGELDFSVIVTRELLALIGEQIIALEKANKAVTILKDNFEDITLTEFEEAIIDTVDEIEKLKNFIDISNVSLEDQLELWNKLGSESNLTNVQAKELAETLQQLEKEIEIKIKLKETGQAIATGFANAMATGEGKQAAQGFSDTLKGIMSAAGFWGKIAAAALAFVEKVGAKGMAKFIQDFISKTGEIITNIIGGSITGIFELLINIPNLVKNIFVGIFEGVVEGIETIVKKVKGFISEVTAARAEGLNIWQFRRKQIHEELTLEKELLDIERERQEQQQDYNKIIDDFNHLVNVGKKTQEEQLDFWKDILNRAEELNLTLEQRRELEVKIFNLQQQQTQELENQVEIVKDLHGIHEALLSSSEAFQSSMQKRREKINQAIAEFNHLMKISEISIQDQIIFWERILKLSIQRGVSQEKIWTIEEKIFALQKQQTQELDNQFINISKIEAERLRALINEITEQDKRLKLIEQAGLFTGTELEFQQDILELLKSQKGQLEALAKLNGLVVDDIDQYWSVLIEISQVNDKIVELEAEKSDIISDELEMTEDIKQNQLDALDALRGFVSEFLGLKDVPQFMIKPILEQLDLAKLGLEVGELNTKLAGADFDFSKLLPVPAMVDRIPDISGLANLENIISKISGGSAITNNNANFGNFTNTVNQISGNDNFRNELFGLFRKWGVFGT